LAVTDLPAQVAIATPQAALAFAHSQSLAVLQHDLGATQTPQGAVVNLSGDVLFDFDRDHLRPDALRSLAELAVLIERSHPHGLRIVGYTDNLGTPKYNLDLSGRRAHNVEHWLQSYGGVRRAGLEVEGRGAARSSRAERAAGWPRQSFRPPAKSPRLDSTGAVRATAEA
jgi:outer membrane protein OmpA-like peptidoglycan-associated protein